MATGNVLLGGIIGAGIDAGTGSGNKLVPERIDLILEEGSGQGDAKFASTKDQEYYEKSILKQQVESDKKAAEKEAAKTAKAVSKMEAVPVAPGEMAPMAMKSNFGPKTR
jgi:hypothetical protein